MKMIKMTNTSFYHPPKPPYRPFISPFSSRSATPPCEPSRPNPISDQNEVKDNSGFWKVAGYLSRLFLFLIFLLLLAVIALAIVLFCRTIHKHVRDGDIVHILGDLIILLFFLSPILCASLCIIVTEPDRRPDSHCNRSILPNVVEII